MKKRIMSLILIYAFALLLIAPVKAKAEVTEVPTIKISKAKATMEVDSSLALKITGAESTPTWTSSEKSVATVSKNGIVTAKSEGKAIITATIDSKNYFCNVVVVNSNKKVFDETLTAGEYIVGEDIPEGKYNLLGVIGAGYIEVYKNEDDYENSSYDCKYFYLASKDDISYKTLSSIYSNEYKNLSLKSGNYIVIYSGLSVNFKTK